MVSLAYRTYLGRDPDHAGGRFYAALLAKGACGLPLFRV